jgi:3-deoxy-D-manno-octulosonate 8-phosphate phosphatase KdsC-like HAD superfamily phosphatase
MTYQIFISLRFAEAGKEAEALKCALEARGISAFLCAVHPGGDIACEIVHALHGCQLAIIMGTRTYGKNTGVGFSTFEELRFIHTKKPFFLIKMCEMFEEPETVFRLGDSVMYFLWLSGHPIPTDLVDKIIEKLTSVSAPTLPESRIMTEKLLSPIAIIPTIPLVSLNITEAIELLIQLGCSAEVRKRATEQNLGIDGSYLHYLQEIEILQELENNSSKLRMPVLKGILAKLKNFQDSGVPSDVLNELRQRIQLQEEKRIREEELRKQEERQRREEALRKQKEQEEKRIREEELKRKAEQEAVLAKQRTEEEKRIREEELRKQEERQRREEALRKQKEQEEKRIREEELKRKAEQEAVLAKQRAEEKRLAEPPQTLSGHSDCVWSVIQLSDGRLASASRDNTVKIWNVNNGTCERTLSGHIKIDIDVVSRTVGVISVIQLSDGRLASGSSDNTVKIWNVDNGTCERTLSGHSEAVHILIQLSDGRLASASRDNTVKIWNVNNGTCERTLSDHSEYVWKLIQLSDGRLASGSSDKTVKIWNASIGSCERTLSGHSKAVHFLIQLSDGRIASVSSDYTVKIWNVTSGTCEITLSGHIGAVWKLIQLADGRVASESDDRTVKIWNVTSGTCEKTLSGHYGAVLFVIQLSDGRLVSGSASHGGCTVMIWNVNNGNCEKSFSGHSGSVLFQLSDGRLASNSDHYTVKIWNV